MRRPLAVERLERLIGQMRQYFPDAWGRNYEPLIDQLTLPDDDDRHVLALAIHYEADYIVTQNTKDFPRPTTTTYGIVALTVDEFISLLSATNPSLIVRAAEAHRVSLTRNPLMPEQYLEELGRHSELERTTAFLRSAGFLDLERPVVANPRS